MAKTGSAWNFTYASDGLRTQRTDGQTTYSYIYTGDKLSHMTVGGNQLHFFYDAGGAPMTVVYNGTTYYYVTNLQGDVIAIRDIKGEAVEAGIKGTKNLNKYLNVKQVHTITTNTFYNDIASRFGSRIFR